MNWRESLFIHLCLPRVLFLSLLQAPALDEFRFLSHSGLHAILERVHYGLTFVSLFTRSILLFFYFKFLLSMFLQAQANYGELVRHLVDYLDQTAVSPTALHARVD